MALSPSIRKVAVLISALDLDAAEAIFAQMSSDDAAKVRRALVELDEIPAGEQQQVLADFLRQQGTGGGSNSPATEDVMLELNPAIESDAAKSLTQPAETRPALEPSSFEFLETVDPQTIAGVLQRELPQTIAVVVANLPPPHAAAVLEALPAALSTEALERIAWLDQLA